MENKDGHDYRLAFATVLVAGWLAYLSNRQQIIQHLRSGEFFVFATISASALLSFFYLLAVAAEYKYKSRNRIGFMAISREQSEMLYDYSVDAFGALPFILLFAGILGFVEKRYPNQSVYRYFVYIVIIFAIEYGYKLVFRATMGILLRFYRIGGLDGLIEMRIGKFIYGFAWLFLGLLALLGTDSLLWRTAGALTMLFGGASLLKAAFHQKS